MPVSAIYQDSDYWDGTIQWGADPTSSDRWNPDWNADQTARDAAYVASYTSLSAWVSGRASASSGGTDEDACIFGPWESSDTTAVGLTGFASDNHEIFAVGVARAGSIWDDTDAYTLNDTSSAVQISIQESTHLDGLQVLSNATDTIYTDNVDSLNVDISNCFIRPVAGSRGFRDTAGATNGTIRIWNTIIACLDVTEGNEGILGDLSTSDITCYNVTVYNMNDGYEIDGGIYSIYNSIASTCTDDFDGTFTAISYCCSDDGDGTNAQNPSGSDWANEWNDHTNGDFSLLSGGNCVGNGTDNPGSGLYSNDINGETRTSTWDIGADEYVASGGNTYNYSSTDSATASDTSTGSATSSAAISESVNASDSGSASAVADGDKADSSVISDSSEGYTGIGRAAEDSGVISDSSIVDITGSAEALESIVASDITSLISIASSSCSDPVITTGTISGLSISDCQAIESGAISGSFDCAMISDAGISDSAITTDASNVGAITNAIATDSVSISDSGDSSVGEVDVSGIDSVQISDTSDCTATSVAGATDIVNATDSTSALSEVNVSESESLITSDTSEGITGIILALAVDSAFISDTSDCTTISNTTASDVGNVSDMIGTQANVISQCSESVQSDDSTIGNVIISFSVSESADVLNVFDRGIYINVDNIDAISVNDICGCIVTSGAILQETIAISDLSTVTGGEIIATPTTDLRASKVRLYNRETVVRKYARKSNVPTYDRFTIVPRQYREKIIL